MPTKHDQREGPIQVTARQDGVVVWAGEFARSEIVVGRSPRSDVVLDDISVSWIHALVRLDEKFGLILTDKSSNGCFRHGVRVAQLTLGQGGCISMPPFELDFRINTAHTPAEEAYVPTIVAKGSAAPAKTPPRLGTWNRNTEVPPEAKARPIVLRFVQAPADLLGRTFAIEARVNTIGRAPDCDVRLEPRAVSRYHARITPATNGRWTVEDAGSENGVDVNGVRVQSGDVGIGDRIGFGTSLVAVLEEAPTAPGEEVRPPTPTEHTTRDALVVTRERSRLNKEVTIVRVSGRVDSYSYAYLRDEIAQAIDEGARMLIADLSRCSFCDHAGLGVLVNSQVALRQRRGGICLMGLSPQLTDAFLLLRLERVLFVANSEESAIARLAPRN